ncbi:subtilisin-like serine protease [Halovivax ruber XH-70]|uniref:Subtilisin-like serine protease n=1 Tax=Halovivax ruber (strain DSM 18193 / JCM 13892 / XH-70) TaxID=797302 RepID=L0IA42_HALRX|nr:S8 family peptidase [Halovivax ruber]AGB15116.1 subtilisin-like serine protease [Halovivax ruber XH-70]
MSNDRVSRRTVLRGVGAGAATTALAGKATASSHDEYVVGLARGTGPGVAKEAAASVRREFDFGGVGTAVSGTFSEQARKALENNPNVRYVEANDQMQALAQETPWGIDRVDADVLHDNGETGDGADIAILDTGIDSDHADLQANVAGGKCFADECCGQASGGIGGCDDNSNGCSEPWDDDNDHGTHCAGSADAVDNAEGVVGVSTEANLWAGKVLNGCGSGSYDNIAAGIEWAADQGFDVASLSLGGEASQVVKDACQYAYDNGVLLVAAAGNDGECTDCVGYPAAYEECIAVSATSEDDSLASFSSTGPEVEIAAPGEGVLSTVPTESSSNGLDTFSGTSMATPHVAGAGGQLMASGYTNTEARQQLRDTAEDIGLADNEQGYGLLDAEAAVLGGDGGGGNGAPTVDSLSASEVETDDGDAEFDVDWSVSDADGNLDSVDLTLTDDTAGETEDTVSVSASGDTASGTDRLVATGDDGSGNDYTVELVVTDADGASSSDTATVSETEDTGGDTAPAIDQFAVGNSSNGGWARFEVDWAVSDADGDLSTVDLVMEQNGSTVDSASESASGSSASGTTRLEDKKGSGSYDITLTVTDAAGKTSTQTKTVTA